MFLIENDTLALRPYTHDDDIDWYNCWLDTATQKGYNTRFDQTFESFCRFDIQRFRFWVTVVHKGTGESIGTLRLGTDVHCPDLAIWIYPEYRGKGWGTASFRLALMYLFGHFDIEELSAGCYCDNVYSLKMLQSIGFIRHPEGDESEPHCFTGETTTQYEFRLKKTDFL